MIKLVENNNSFHVKGRRKDFDELMATPTTPEERAIHTMWRIMRKGAEDNCNKRLTYEEVFKLLNNAYRFGYHHSKRLKLSDLIDREYTGSFKAVEDDVEHE